MKKTIGLVIPCRGRGADTVKQALFVALADAAESQAGNGPSACAPQAVATAVIAGNGDDSEDLRDKIQQSWQKRREGCPFFHFNIR